MEQMGHPLLELEQMGHPLLELEQRAEQMGHPLSGVGVPSGAVGQGWVSHLAPSHLAPPGKWSRMRTITMGVFRYGRGASRSKIRE